MKTLFDLQELLRKSTKRNIPQDWRQQVRDNAESILNSLDNGETGEEFKAAREAVVGVLKLGDGHSVSQTEKAATKALDAALMVLS